MRAALLRDVGDKLEIRDDLRLDAPGPGEVRVRLRASGVCHTDLSIQQGAMPHPLPCIPGHEGAGEVVAVGDGVISVVPGDHVVLAWVPPCGRCRPCLRGQPNLCAELGLGNLGASRLALDGLPVFAGVGTATFAEETVVPASAAIPIDRDVPFELAALLGCAVTTGVGAAINTARVRPGSTVLVIGAGGVGMNVIQGAAIAGAASIAVVEPADAKFDVARRFGASHVAHPNQTYQLLDAITEGQGFDYAFDAVGHPDTIRAAWDATRRGGTTVVVGAGRLDAQVCFNAFELFYSERQLKGCVYGSADVRTDFHRLLALWRGGRLDLEGLISHRIELDDLNDALQAMSNGEVIRAVVTFP